jgi:putative endonuclease
MSPRPPRSPDEWADPRHRLGLTGEEDAIGYLTALGWAVEAHRFRLGRNDIDLIARRGAVVAFVEVKTRRGEEFGPGRVGVAEVWRLRHGRPGDLYRFDVIEVIPRICEPSDVEHLEDAWRGGDR